MSSSLIIAPHHGRVKVMGDVRILSSQTKHRHLALVSTRLVDGAPSSPESKESSFTLVPGAEDVPASESSPPSPPNSSMLPVRVTRLRNDGESGDIRL